MEDIAADDDLLSDMLLDSLEFEPKIATHKMNQAYRSPRYKTQDVIDIVRNRVVVECDVNAALEDLLKLDVIKKHLATKTLRQTQEFQLHSRRYLETYLPDSGVEFALTTRYKRVMDQSKEAQTSKAGSAEAQARAEEQARQEANKQQNHSSAKGKSRILGENGIALGTTKADLCVVATKPFKAGDLILLCKGGVKDLTKSEDEALREEAAVDRERQKEQEYNGVLGQGRDFSVIRSARKGCSQLLLGPARFVNHDCDPNCEFHRLGSSQMVFKCLRNIGLNEEITTYYGDNYFEWENSECMCRTCEERGRGFFSSKESEELILEGKETAIKAEILKQRRTSQRKVVNPSPPPGKTILEPTTTTFEKNGKTTTKTFHHHVSQRELDEDSTTHRGPKCICLTCGTSFWAPEAWWMPDECRRCERHYRIFKADWPGRLPTEGGWSARAKKKRKEWEMKDTEAKKRKMLHAPSPGVSGGSNSETDTPVKLSPLRIIEGDEEPVKSQKAKKRRKVLKVNADEGTDEDAIDAALRRASPAGASMSKSAVDRNEDESDLTSVSDEGDAEEFVLPTMTGRSTPSSSGSDRSSSTSSKPSGPKMLGKEAKTETLALYWGAPSGDRRKSRQSQTGLESLSKTVARNTSNRKEHRRNISDMSTASAPPKTGVQHRIITGMEETVPQRRESLPDLEVPASATHEDDLTVRQSPFVTVSEVATEEASPQLSATSDTSPLSGFSGLATKGAARTSVKNLAMAWSAGVDEGGRGSRRRQARDFSQSIANLPMPAAKRKSMSKDESREPEEDKQSIVEDALLPAAMDNVPPTPPPLVSEVKDLPVEGVVSPAISNVDSPNRTSSPISGPPPSFAFASRPGVIPGKPIRKNLRWGSGKVSTSRPFVGSAASFPGAPSTTTTTTTSGFAANSSPSQTAKLSSPAYPRTTSHGSAFIGHEENVAERETPSPMPIKERKSSPFVRTALHTSIASSTQLQSATSNGYNSYPSNGNGIKQRHASPISLMGPPRTLLQESVSPTTHISHSMMVPKIEGDPVQGHSTGTHDQQPARHYSTNNLQQYSMQSGDHYQQ